MLIRQINKLNNLHINAFFSSVKTFPIHMHDAYEIIFVLEGSVNFKCTAFNYKLTKGDIFVVNVKELHSISETEEENLLLVLQLDPYQYLNLFPKLDYYIFVCDSFSNENKTNDKLRNLQASLANIMLLIHDKKSDAYDLIEESVIKLIHLLISDYQSFNLEQTGYHNKSIFKNDSIQTERIFRIQEYIYKHYTQKIDLEGLANHIHLNKYYVSHLIKTATGLSMTDFLSLTRVEQSEMLLLNSSMSIDQIALECGFSARRYYEKHFMKWYNMKPTEYRKNYLKSIHQITKEKPYYEVNYDLAVRKLREFCSKKIASNILSNTQLYEIDFSSPCKAFVHDWEESLFVSDFLNCLNIVSPSLILDAQKEIKFTNVKLGNVLEHFLNHTPSPSSFEFAFFNLIDFLVQSNLNPTIMISPLFGEQENIIMSLKKLLSYCIRKYGVTQIENWSFELRLDSKSPRNTKKTTSFLNDFLKITDQYSKNIEVNTKHYFTRNEKYIFNSTSLVPFIIHKTLHPQDASPEVYRELFDITLDQKETSNTLSGCNGLFTINGIRKPIYHVWSMLSMLGNKIIKVEDGLIVSKRGEDFYVMIYDFKNINASDSLASISINEYTKKNNHSSKIIIKPLNVQHNYSITKLYLDSNNSPFRHLAAMNFPKLISNEERDFINTASSPKVAFSSITHHSPTNIEFNLNHFSAELLIFKRS